jgi:hypothetical protein
LDINKFNSCKNKKQYSGRRDGVEQTPDEIKAEKEMICEIITTFASDLKYLWHDGIDYKKRYREKEDGKVASSSGIMGYRSRNNINTGKFHDKKNQDSK